MTPLREPPRLLDPGTDLPDWQRAPLEAGTRDLPSPERLARIAALLPGAPIGPGPGAPPTPPVAPALPSAIPGAVAGTLLGLALVGAGWIATPRAPLPPSAPPATSATIMAPAPEPPQPPATRPAAPRARAAPDRPSAAASPPVPAASEPPAPTAGVAPDTSAASAEPQAPEVEPETVLLKRAQDALRADPARALSLTDVHLARYPGGVLAQEREVLAISALLGMGRGAEARARATRFVARFPTSMHRRRLAVLIPDLESSEDAHKEPASTPSTP